jgi:hypothetical protein
MNAPSGRYKVVERDRRLITIDTQTGQEIGLGGSVTAQPPSNKAMQLPQVTGTLPVSVTNTVLPKGTPAAGNPWQRTAHERPSDRSETRAASQRNSTQFGRFVVRTAPSFDNNGPRTIVLSAVGVLSWAIMHHWRVFAVVLGVAFLFIWLFFLVPLLLIGGVRQAVVIPFRPSLTKLFDACDQVDEG